MTTNSLGDKAQILQFLKTKHEQNVPIVLLENPLMGAFITHELSQNLRSLLKTGRGVTFLEKAVLEFACLQKKTGVDIVSLKEIGLLDWSLNKIPELSAQLFHDEKLLMYSGLAQEKYVQLNQVQARIEQSCKNLLSDELPITLVQCDFHGNNIVVDRETDKVGFIDLGKVVVSQPFYSILTFIKQTRGHHFELLS